MQLKERRNLRRVADLFSNLERKKIVIVGAIQVLLSALDLVAISMLGLLGALSISGVQSRDSSTFDSILTLLRINSFDFRVQVALLGSIAASIFVIKTFLSVTLTRRTLFFLSARGAKISDELLRKVITQPRNFINSRTSQELIYALSSGVNTIVLGVVGTSITLVADLSLIVILLVSLIALDTLSAISTIAIFGIVGWLLYRFLHERARKIGIEQSQLMVQNNNKIMELIRAYREILVRNKRSVYADIIGSQRRRLSHTYGELAFLPFVGKYVVEITLILGILILSAIQFTTKNAESATSTLAFFIAAATRLAPAVLRIQQGAITIRYSIGVAQPTLDLIEAFPEPINLIEEIAVPSKFEATISVKSVSFSYPGSNFLALNNINLEINPGELVAIVGPTGSGKTTLMDIVLGIVEPQSGSVEVSGLPPLEAIRRWEGRISYVPQDIFVSNDTIRSNILLGIDDSCEDELIFRSLKNAQLDNYVDELPLGMATLLGEEGNTMSGGQRQRLGIARALLTNPDIICLDEATSSLDSITEELLSKSISEMRGLKTIIMIAHRLSTVVSADKVLFMRNGRIESIGTFSDVRREIPDFDQQAKLMGL
jgi:ATP-binding cassette, subfamily B, bacterial PglK